MDKNGNVSFFAELETLSEKQRERIEESKEEKGGYIRGGRVKRTRVTASSTEELLDKINKVDWSKIKEEKQEEKKEAGTASGRITYARGIFWLQNQ